MRNIYGSLDEEYRKKREQVELGLNLFNLLTEAGEYNLDGLKLMCRNLVESSTVRDSDFQKIKLKVIETPVGLTQNNLVALSFTDGDMLKFKFVSKEEYYGNLQKLLEIERMKQEVEKIQQMIMNKTYKLVKVEIESRGEDPAIRPYVKEAGKEVIAERYQKETKKISDEELKKSFNKVLFSLSGFGEGIGTSEGRVGELVIIVYLNSSGKSGEDIISVEKIMRSILERKEPEGSYNYYNSCVAFKAMILYYSNKGPPVLSVLRKKGKIKILKKGILHQNSNQL